MYAAEPGDTYLDDGIHYMLSAEKKLLVTEPMERHKHRGEWWWSGNVPGDVSPEAFYLRPTLRVSHRRENRNKLYANTNDSRTAEARAGCAPTGG